MSRNLLSVIIAIVVVAIVVAVWMLVIRPKQTVTSQALITYTVPPSPPSPPSTVPRVVGIPFAVQSGSYLAKYNGIPVSVVLDPIYIGDSVWLIIETPDGNYVAEVMNVVDAQAIGVGTTITKGTIITPIVL